MGDFFNSGNLGCYQFIFYKNYKKFLHDKIAKHDLNLIQGFCLLLVHDFGDINQKDLAKGLFITKGAVTKAIKKLEDDGWILRERQHTDKRKFSLKLSQKGEEIIPILQEMNDEWESKMGLDSLSPEFMETLKQLTIRSIELNLETE